MTKYQHDSYALSLSKKKKKKKKFTGYENNLSLKILIQNESITI